MIIIWNKDANQFKVVSYYGIMDGYVISMVCADNWQ